MEEINKWDEFVKNTKLGLLRAQFSANKAYMKKYINNMYFLEGEIFHYTDLNGLQGILESKGFWLSEAKFLNDAEELYNGAKLTKSLIEKLIVKERYSPFKEILLETLAQLKTYDYKNNYIASFSLKSDDLEQWRAYAKNGSGVCIGLDINKKTTYPHFTQSNLWTLRKVIYNDDIKTWILYSIIFKYFYEYKKDIMNGVTYIDNDYIESLTKSLARVYIYFKNKAFESENETRLVYDMGDPLKLFNKKYYRNVNNVLVPYICSNDTKLKNGDGKRLEVDLLPITKIIVGPTVNQDVTTSSIKNFVEDIGYNKSIVQLSEIPYRG